MLLTQRVVPGTRVYHADGASDLLREMLVQPDRAVVSTTRPDVLVRAALAGSRRAFLIAAASPEHSVGHLVERHGIPPLTAVRGVMGDIAALVEMVRSDRALVIEESDVAPADARSTIARIAEHFELPCGPEDGAVIAERLGQCHASSETGSASLIERCSEIDRVAIALCLREMSRTLIDGTCERIIAAKNLFIADDTRQPPLAPIDATGRQRLLIYGPFLAVPTGDWTARCVFSFSPELIGSAFSVDVIHLAGGFHELARTSFTITSAGRLDVNIRFVHSEPSAQLEVRLFSDRAVFDGTVSLGLVEFCRNTAVPHSPDDVGMAVVFPGAIPGSGSYATAGLHGDQ